MYYLAIIQKSHVELVKLKNGDFALPSRDEASDTYVGYPDESIMTSSLSELSHELKNKYYDPFEEREPKVTLLKGVIKITVFTKSKSGLYICLSTTITVYEAKTRAIDLSKDKNFSRFPYKKSFEE